MFVERDYNVRSMDWVAKSVRVRFVRLTSSAGPVVVAWSLQSAFREYAPAIPSPTPSPPHAWP